MIVIIIIISPHGIAMPTGLYFITVVFVPSFLPAFFHFFLSFFHSFFFVFDA